VFVVQERSSNFLDSFINYNLIISIRLYLLEKKLMFNSEILHFSEILIEKIEYLVAFLGIGSELLS